MDIETNVPYGQFNAHFDRKIKELKQEFYKEVEQKLATAREKRKKQKDKELMEAKPEPKEEVAPINIVDDTLQSTKEAHKKELKDTHSFYKEKINELLPILDADEKDEKTNLEVQDHVKHTLHIKKEEELNYSMMQLELEIMLHNVQKAQNELDNSKEAFMVAQKMIAVELENKRLQIGYDLLELDRKLMNVELGKKEIELGKLAIELMYQSWENERMVHEKMMEVRNMQLDAETKLSQALLERKEMGVDIRESHVRQLESNLNQERKNMAATFQSEKNKQDAAFHRKMGKAEILLSTVTNKELKHQAKVYLDAAHATYEKNDNLLEKLRLNKMDVGYFFRENLLKLTAQNQINQRLADNAFFDKKAAHFYKLQADLHAKANNEKKAPMTNHYFRVQNNHLSSPKKRTSPSVDYYNAYSKMGLSNYQIHRRWMRETGREDKELGI